MTLIKVSRKLIQVGTDPLDPGSWVNEDTNDWLAANGIPPLPEIQKVTYRMGTGDLYGMVLKANSFSEEEKWFWFSDSEQEWKPMSYSPW